MDIRQAIRFMSDVTGVAFATASKRAGLPEPYLADKLAKKSGIRIDTYL